MSTLSEEQKNLTEEQKEVARRIWMGNPRNVGLLGLLFSAVQSEFPATMPAWMLPGDRK